MVDEPLVELRQLSTAFDTPRGLLTAVQGVSLRVTEGQAVGVVGESGSGKSVLMRTVMGLLPRTALVAGKVLYRGTDVTDLSPSHKKAFMGPKMAMVFQDPSSSLNPVKRIGRHVSESLRRHTGLGRTAAATRSVELLAEVGIPDPEHRARQYPHELSGGMRQRVVIAMAIACRPRLLIADEPTTALDVTVQKQILDLLMEMRQQRGMSMVLVSHDLGVISGRTDRVVVMYAGRVMESAPTAKLFRSVRHPYTAALLASSPKLDQPRHASLPTIEGHPPDLTKPVLGCVFASRCERATQQCREVTPPLVEHAADHEVACHHPVDVVDHSYVGVIRSEPSAEATEAG